MTRLKGDETYRKCGYCKQPIRDDENATGIGAGGEQAWFHGDECFGKWCNEIPQEISRRKARAGVQTVIDLETGEVTDEEQVALNYTDTSISGKQLINERMRLGEFVKITLTAQVVQVGEAIDNNGLKMHVQKCKVMVVDEVQRGPI